MDRFIVGLCPDTIEYVVNGVRYIVERRYEPADLRHMSQNTRIDHRLQNYLNGDFAELTLLTPSDTMKAESVRSAAGEEDGLNREKLRIESSLVQIRNLQKQIAQRKEEFLSAAEKEN